MKGHVETLRPDYHKIILELGRDSSGKRNRRVEYFSGGKRGAEKRLTELLNQLEHGTLVDKTKLSLADFLDQWLTEYAANKVAPSTLKRYSGLIANNIKPIIGAVRLSDLKALHVEHLYTALATSGRSDGRGGLSAQTVLHVHRVLTKALKSAVRWRLIDRSPMEFVEAPTVTQREMHALDTDASVRLLSAIQGTRYHAPTLLALATGARRGELLALRWADLDSDSGMLLISRSLTDASGVLEFKSPKTRRSYRSIPLPKFALDELRQHRREQTESRISMGAAWQDNDLIFPDPTGRPWKPDSFSAGFILLRDKCGVSVRFHDLRHSAASQLLKAGVPVVTVSERLGHSSPSVTNKTYSHVLPGMQAEATRVVEEAYSARMRPLEDAACAGI